MWRIGDGYGPNWTSAGKRGASSDASVVTPPNSSANSRNAVSTQVCQPCFFSRVRRVGAGDPGLGPLPADAEALQRLADRLVAEPPRRDALGAGDLGGQGQSPERGRLAEVARAAVQQVAEPPAGVVVDQGPGGPGPMRALGQAADAGGVEGAEGAAHGLRGAADAGADRGGLESLGASQEDLAAPQG